MSRSVIRGGLRVARTGLMLAVVLVLLACDRTDSDRGLDASLHVANAQFFREAMPCTVAAES